MLLHLALLAILGPDQIYAGRERQLEVQPPRIDAEVVIDGVLDEPPWRQAARLTGFSRYAPTDDAPADDSTEVLVWYSPTAIHFGIRAYAAPGTVHATLADRDKIYQDDYIGILLSTFNDGRQATVFATNPLGIQGDGIVVESGVAQSEFNGTLVGREPTDINPDFVFESKGHVTDFGYEVEIRIPFKSLRYQRADPQTWGFNVLRKVQSRGYEYSWAPARRAAVSYLQQFGHLQGLTGLKRGIVLDLNPVLTQHVNGTPTDHGYIYGGERPQLGGNLSWGMTSDLTLNGTVRPDFAEVETDAGQLVTDPRLALYFDEKRPFFLASNELFNAPGGLIYTRRILQPIAAAKITGKVDGTSIAFLSAVDDRRASETGNDNPIFNLVRLQRDFGAGSKVGILYTDKEDGNASNRVLSLDGRFVLGKLYSTNLRLTGSQTTEPGLGTLVGPSWGAVLARAGRTFSARYAFAGYSDNFQASSGFITRPNIADATLINTVTLYPRSRSVVENYGGDVVLEDTWQYQSFVLGEDALEKKLHLNGRVALHGGWQLGASVLFETFGFDKSLYADYAVARPTGTGIDTVPFVGIPRIPNRDYLASLTSPEFQHFSFNLFYLWGRDENFFEWAPANIGFVTIGATWRPNSQLRFEGTYNWQYYHRLSDGTTVGQTRIPRLKVEYQLTRTMFLRAVGQYTADQRDSLRDVSHDGDPILIRNADGIYELALRQSTNLFRGDLLFSWLPSPGTVFYAGYGSTSDEAEPLRFRSLSRQSDGFFLKLSYLFRV